jgi:hypothetical protein
MEANKMSQINQDTAASIIKKGIHNKQKTIQSVFENVVYIRYVDHVMFSRVEPLFMSPQTREAIGWLVYECEQYITIKYDQDAGPPTLKGGDPKASGLLLLRSDILEMKKLDNIIHELSIHKNSHVLNNQTRMNKGEYALSATKVKNSHNKRNNKKEEKYRCYSHDS